MLIAPEGRFIPVNMDRCQDLMGGLLEHVTPVRGRGITIKSLLIRFLLNSIVCVFYFTTRKRSLLQGKFPEGSVCSQRGGGGLCEEERGLCQEGGSLSGVIVDRDPPPWAETPWKETSRTKTQTETPLDRDPWTETPRQRPAGQRPLLRTETHPWTETSPGQRPPTLGRDPLERDSLDTDPQAETSWTESPPPDRDPSLDRDPPLDRDNPWTETPLDGDPLDRNFLDRDPLDRDPPWTETSLNREPLDRDPLYRDPPPSPTYYGGREGVCIQVECFIF